MPRLRVAPPGKPIEPRERVEYEIWIDTATEKEAIGVFLLDDQGWTNENELASKIPIEIKVVSELQVETAVTRRRQDERGQR